MTTRHRKIPRSLFSIPLALAGIALALPAAADTSYSYPRVVEGPTDRLEREPERAVDLDLLEPQELGAAVQAVTGRAPRRGFQEPDRVVVVQRAHGDVGHPRHLAHPMEPVASVHAVTLRPHVA